MEKKLLILFLALLCAGSCFFGCAKPNDPGEVVNTSNEATSEKSNKPQGISKDYYVDYETDDLPENLKYGNAEFSLLCDSSHTSRAFVEKPTGETVTQVLYERMKAVEERLDVLLFIDSQQYTYGSENSFISKMDINAMGGSAYDLVLTHPLLPAILMERGLICNLAATEYFNSEKPWWSSTLLEQVAIDNKIYFTADNSSWNNLRNMMTIFVDKDVFGRKHPEMQIDDLYDLVDNKEWTMEKMFELTEGIYESTDGDDTADENDIYGLSTASKIWLEGYFFAAGFSTVQPDGQGDFNITLRNSNIVDFTDWFIGKYHQSQDIYYEDPVQYGMFLKRKVMFYQSVLSMVEQKIEQTFTVLPMPMYEPAAQGNRYYTHFCNYYDMYSIPSSVPMTDRARSSAVMECLASEAYRRVAPTYFELYLKSRNVSDERMASMYDQIRSGVVFDIGYVYGFLFSTSGGNIDMPIYSFRSALNSSTSLGAVWSEEKQLQYNNRLKEIIQMVKDLQY